jgi:hypothetical protein
MKTNLTWLLAGLLTLSVGAEAQKKAKTSAAPAVVSKPDLNLNDPTDANKANRKITSSLKDGENAFYTWEGNVYSRIPGEKDRLLFTYQGMNVRASKTVMDSVKGYGWRHVSREILLYMDPKTKEVMRTWKNEWTGENCDVIHVANDPVNGRGPTFADPNGKSPYKLSGRIHDGYYLQLSEIPLFYTNPLAGDFQDYVGGTYQAMEIFNTSVPVKELVDGNKDQADDVQISWTRISKFLPWMKMGDRVGYLIFSGIGKKVKSFDNFPETLKKEIMANYPEYTTAPPTDDARPNETSWTYFKKKMAAKKTESKGAGH